MTDRTPDCDRWTRLGPLDSSEIRAEAFRVMTGHMAPYKSASPLSYPAPFEERVAAYNEWIDKYNNCVRAVMHAYAEIRPTIRGDDDD